uniref:8.9 kDa family member n=1 Tax=Rhipicephalus zambeziensis TaxID=60191 RepID=A0A224YA95_9ACAR
MTTRCRHERAVMFMMTKLSVTMLLCWSYFIWSAREAEATRQWGRNVTGHNVTTRRRGTRYNVTWREPTRHKWHNVSWHNVTCKRNGTIIPVMQYVVRQFPCEHWKCRRSGRVRVTACRGTKPDHPCIHMLTGTWPTCCYFYYYCRDQ